MGAAYFYHLTESPLEQVLPMLAGKALEAGWRVAVRAGDSDLLPRLDAALWLGQEDGFLPHGIAGGPHDARQPVLLCTGAEAANGATCVMSVAGADVQPDEVGTLERVCVIFDGMDPDAVARARVQWKALTGAGIAAQYWAQEDGRWIKKADG